MYDEAKAERVLRFISCLKHTKSWHGVPFRILKWQEQVVRDIFGTVRPNGYRQYTQAWIEIPKKNGKSEFGAALALYLMCADGEYGAEVYGAATDRGQASHIFDVAVEMVDQCPALKKRIKLMLSRKRMIYLPTQSFYQVLSRAARGKQGFNIHGLIFDEIHEQPDRRLYDTLTQGSGDARKQPLFIFLTTAGDDPDRTSIAWQLHQKALRVLENPEVDPSFYAVVYGVDEDADPGDERNWYKANPALGEIIDLEKVRDHWRRAKGDPAELRKFKQFRLNIWVRDKLAKWMPLSKWDASAGLMPKPEKLRGRVCYGGLDLSSTTDTTSFVLVFPPVDGDPYYYVLPYFWIPEDNMQERVRRDGVPYDQWARQGFIKTTEGDVIDYEEIEKTILSLANQYHIVEVGYDPWNATQTALRLADRGITMVNTRQGPITQSPAMKTIEVLVAKKLLRHGGHPVLRWQIGNAEVRKDDNDNYKLVKGKSTERVDGVAALINAIARMNLHIRHDEHDKDDVEVVQAAGVKVY